MNDTWELQFLGWPAWTLILLWIIGAYGLWKGLAPEWQQRGIWLRLSAWFLRALSLALLLAMLGQPVVSQREVILMKPQLTVVIDQSSSMAHQDPSMHPTYQFDELQALGLLAEDQRNHIAKQCSNKLLEIRSFLKNAVKKPKHKNTANQLYDFAKDLRGMLTSLIGHQYIAERTQEICNLLISNADLTIKKNKIDEKQYKRLIRKIDIPLIQALAGIQQHADAALAAGAGGSETLKTALAEWRTLNRSQRAQMFVTNKFEPVFQTTSDLHIVPLHAPHQSIATESHASAQSLLSDFYNCFDNLNRQLGGDQQHHVLLLSDGIHNGDKDPLSIARALGARGIPIHSLCIGDLDQPRDAVLLDIVGPSEMYRTDDIPITIRYRISGYPGQQWDVILFINGKEYAREITVGTGLVQEHYFTVSDLPATRLKVEAQIKAHIDVSKIKKNTHSYYEELWQGVKDTSLFSFFDQKQKPLPNNQRNLLAAELQRNRQDHFIRRLRSYIIAPEAGWYQFAISGDDQGMLWLSTDHNAQHKSLIAYFEEPTKERKWDQLASQQSQPIFLSKDQVYYLEATHLEKDHFDHLDIAWKPSNGDTFKPIPDEQLIPFGDDLIANHLSHREEHNTDNNHKEHIIIAHSDPLRILLVDQYPRWETRLIGNLLSSDEGIQLERFFPGLHQQSQADHIFNNLEQYDALILGDISASLLSNEIQDRIANTIREHGLLLIVIAGRSAMPHGFALGPLADVLPVTVNATPITDHHQWQLAPLADDPLSNLDNQQWQWSHLPALAWVNGHVTAKPQAVTHIMSQSKDGIQAPYCCSQHVGAGRIIYFGSDESWRWRERIGKSAHRKWWRHVIQWGLQSRLHGTDPRLRVAISQRQADNAKNILIHARCFDQGKNFNDSLSLILEQLDGAQQRWQIKLPGSAEQSQSSICLGDHVNLQAGHYRCSIRSRALPVLVEQREFWIRAPNHTELNDLGTDKAFLDRLSQISQGKSFLFEDSNQLIDYIESHLETRTQHQTHTLHVWRSWYIFLAVLLLLSTEWWLRKRVGLP